MLLESKSLLAKLMATENLVVEQRKVSTALFDTKTRVLVVPVLDKNIPPHTYDLFMGHEVGHALWTPAEGHDIREKYDVPHSLANIVEDSRIERKIKYKYPGLKNSFIKGYQDLIERNFFNTKGRNIDHMKFIDRLNLHCKGGAILNIHFTDDEMELVREVESTETYDDVMKVCQNIKEFIKNKSQQESKFEFPEFDDEEGEIDHIDFDYEDDLNEEGNDEVEIVDTPEKESSEEKKEDETEESETTEEVVSEDETEENIENDTILTNQEDDISDLLSSETEEAYRDNEHKLFSDDNRTYTYANIPKIDINQRVVDHKDVYRIYNSQVKENSFYNNSYFYDVEGFRKIRSEINTAVSYLVKEFEMRKSANQLKKAGVSKSGDLNMSKIYSHRFNEDIFKKITVVPDAKSHGLVIFQDWSGSMEYHLGPTMKQLFNIVMFCKKVNIPYEVYTFTDNHVDDYPVEQNKKTDDIQIRDFKLLNILSSRMSAAEFTNAASALVSIATKNLRTRIFGMGGTPLSEAIISAMEIVPDFQKKNNLQVVNTIFLTDGEGDSIKGKYNETGHIDSLSSYDYKRGRSQTVIIRDPVTKNQEELKGSQSGTNELIKLFKLRTKCNVVGFYILSPNEFKSYLNRHLQGMDTQDIRSSFSKNQCAIINNAGFDEYYLLRVNKKDEPAEIEVKENASNKALASAFAKYNHKRGTSRIVLNRFINLIA